MRRTACARLPAVQCGSILLLLCASSAARATPNALEVERFAIVIGNNQTSDTQRSTLRYADDDAIAIHGLLAEAGVSSVVLVDPDDDTRALHPQLAYEQATLAQVERQVAQVAARVRETAASGRASEFWLFYSGHGNADSLGEGYVQLQDQRLTRSTLFSLLARIDATYQHVIVDACKSNLLVLPRGPGGRHRPYTGSPLALAAPAELRNTGFVLSTSSGRESHEWERFHGGILSHELRSALRGAADLDRDRAISYAELGAFLESANSAIVPRFRPDFMVRAPGGDYGRPVIEWRTEPSIALEAADWGHVYVETARGERLLDMHPGPGRSASLWAPPERPLFVRRHDETVEYVVTEPAPNSRVDKQTARRPPLANKGALSLAFEQLFAAPFVALDLERYAQRVPTTLGAPRRASTLTRAAKTSSGRPGTWIAAGSTALLGTTTLVLSIMTRDEFTETAQLATDCGRCDAAQVRDLQSTGRSLQTFTNVSLALTAAAAAATVGLFFLEPTDESAPRVSLGPGAAAVTGRF